jgi:hypothetical protein
MRKASLIILVLAALLMATGSVVAAPATRQAEHHDNVFFAVLSGGQEVPPVSTRARGVALFHLSHDGTELKYLVVVANLNNPVAAHIHVGAKGVNGPVVAFLFGPAAPGGGRVNGILATGTITAADLVGPLAGQPLSALVDQIRAGNTYANVHTNDGVDPPGTGPGDFPTGEIRGQLR